MTTPSYRPAPEWETDRWFNAPAPLTLAGLRGRVVLLGAFQMLCPGCVQTLLPQLQQAHADRSLRATAVRLNVLRIDGLPPRAAAVLQGLGAGLAGQALGEVVLHHLRDKDLVLADGLGMQPGPITVTPQGLRIDFVPRTTP